MSEPDYDLVAAIMTGATHNLDLSWVSHQQTVLVLSLGEMRDFIKSNARMDAKMYPYGFWMMKK